MSRLSAVAAAVVLALSLQPVRAQSDRGSLTGSVADASGASVPLAGVIAANLGTGVQFRSSTTDTGMYTISSLPSGDYSITVEHPGFRKFIQSPVSVQVAQTTRVDVSLQLGAATESITVSASASLLQQDSSDDSMTVTGDRMNSLPLNFAVGPGAIRSPFGFLELVPGASNTSLDVQQANGWGIDIRVNGMPNNTFKALVDGQDGTNPQRGQLGEENQPSNEAIQSFTLQSSNYAAEFGQVGGGLINFTTRSGSNQWHGSAYEHWRNEALEAGLPFTNDGSGHLVRSRDRQNDFGGSVGGPVWIPRLYNGRNKTFFFFNYEMFRKTERRYSGYYSLPSTDFRNGDFSYLFTGKVLGKDYLGNNVLEGMIYDPSTTRTAAGNLTRDPFPGNIIPISRFDPVAKKIQDLIPMPNTPGPPVNNYSNLLPVRKIMSIPSIKIDENLARSRVSLYFSKERVDKDNVNDFLPLPLTARRYQNIWSITSRLNYDYTIGPTMLNHMGVGILRYYNPDQTPVKNYDQLKELGLPGSLLPIFPAIAMPLTPTSNLNFGGPYNLYASTKPTAVESLTWVHGNHTYKFGGEWHLEATTNSSASGANGTYNFGTAQTSLPTTNGMGLQGGTIGNGYASFLLGLVNTANIGNPSGAHYRRQGWAFFAQDTWKIRRNLSFDYGLRYDLQPVMHELYHRMSEFDPSIPNPVAGGLLGATAFAGSGPGRCNCDFASTYPYQIGPRLGIAWMIRPKTVFRAGWGLTYGQGQREGLNAANSLGFGFNSVSFSNPGFGETAFQLKDGMKYNVSDLTAVTINPGIRPQLPQLNSPPSHVDANAGKTPRIQQWTIGLQRELNKDLLVAANYVANRVIWLQNDSLVDYNAITPERLNAFGLDLNSYADRTLLTSRLDSATAIARGFKAPFPNFPMSSTVAQSLRPYPQFGTISSLWAPLGNSWYDSLQARLVKRFSHGVDASVAYTWSKNLTNTTTETGGSIPINDVFNRPNQKSYSPSDQPQVLSIGFRYQIPLFGSAGANRFARAWLKGWNLSGVMRYASGTPFAVPSAQNNLGAYLMRGTFANRVPGVPLFTKDLNCHCIDPNTDFVLNPAAWSDPAPGQWGYSSPYYGDYRHMRRPKESLSLGKSLKLQERYTIEFRAEFFNVLNRTVIPDPSSTSNALLSQKYNPVTGFTTQGFGRIDPTQAQVGTPRTGQLLLRIGF